MGPLAPDWWMRGVTRSGVRNAPFREASRREVEPEAGWGEGRSPDLYRADAREDRVVFSALLLGSCSRLRLLLLLFWFLRSRPCERPVGGDADRRRSRAGGVVDLRVRTRGAGEGSPAAWEAGTRSDHADGRGRGTRRPLKGGLFLVFGCMLWRRVLPSRNCASDCAVNKSLLVVGRIVCYLPVNCITALLVLCV